MTTNKSANIWTGMSLPWYCRGGELPGLPQHNIPRVISNRCSRTRKQDCSQAPSEYQRSGKVSGSVEDCPPTTLREGIHEARCPPQSVLTPGGHVTFTAADEQAQPVNVSRKVGCPQQEAPAGKTVQCFALAEGELGLG